MFSLILEGEKGREGSIKVREKHWVAASCTHTGWGSYTPRTGMESQPRYNPTGNETHGLWSLRDAPTN